MDITERIRIFDKLGERIENLSDTEVDILSGQASVYNRWFSFDSVSKAFAGLAHMLKRAKLDQWTSGYHFKTNAEKTVGVVMAGNIPMVGFHDLMSILISGHIAAVKLSSSDEVLMHQIINWLLEIEPRFVDKIQIRDRLKEIDAVIATGSDNTARYFEYYFSGIPNVIRKNRSSIAILSGSETQEQIQSLGNDMFDYYGLGCRNVSKIFYPAGFDFTTLLDQWNSFEDISHHNKYRNNYDYHKSILLVNRDEHLDTGFALFKPSTELVSPTSVFFIQTYDTPDQYASFIEKNRDKIQCIVSQVGIDGEVPFGKAQKPEPWDYADNVDTLKFLQKL